MVTQRSILEEDTKKYMFRTIRKISVAVLGIHTFILAFYLIRHSTSDYHFWNNLFSQNWMKSLNTLYSLSLCGHGYKNIHFVLSRYISKFNWASWILQSVLLCLFSGLFIIQTANFIWKRHFLYGILINIPYGRLVFWGFLYLIASLLTWWSKEDDIFNSKQITKE